MKNNKKSTREVFYSIGLIFLTLYFELSFIYSDLGISAIVGASVFAAVTFCVIFNSRKIICINYTASKADLYFGCMYILFMINFFRRNQSYSNIYQMLIWSFCFIMISFITSVDNATNEYVLKIFSFFGVMMATIQILHHFFPLMMENFFFSFINNNSVSYNRFNIRLGYGLIFGRAIDYTAIVMVCGLGATLVNMLTNNDNQFSLFSILKCLYMFLGLIFLQRRSEIVTVVIAILSIYWLSRRKEGRSSVTTGQITLLYLIPVFLLLLFVLIDFLPNSSTNRMVQTLVSLKEGSDVTNGRTVLYTIALMKFKENALFGIGWFGFSEFAGLSGQAHVSNVHNIYLQLLCETGIIGSICFIFLLISMLVTMIQNINKKCHSYKKYTLFAAFIQIFLLIYGLMDNPLYKTYFPIFCGISICFSCRDYNASEVN